MKQVLLIEDDQWLADSYKKAVTSGGFSVTAVRDAYSAMEQIKRKTPDVIVADMLLDGHSVLTLLHELQTYNDTKKIPVVICSGVVDRTLSSKLESYGVRAVCDKAEVTMPALVTLIKEMVDE